VRLRPAEALRPPAPAQFRPLLVERLGYARLLTPSQRMVMRNLERKPLRAATTVAGIAGALAIMLAGIFWADAVERFMDVTFDRANRGSVQVGFVQPLVRSVRYDLERLPGVRQVEVSRMAPVRLRAGHRSYRTVINGITDDARLQRAIDGHARVPVPPSPDGIVLTSRLAERLAVRPGDVIHAEFIDGKRTSAEVRIAGLVDEIAGMNGWMRLDDLNALASDGDVVSSAQLLVDRDDEPRLLAALKAMPAAAVVIVSRTLLETFRSTSARNLLFFTTVMAGFAATIAAGVVYNNARIQLSERAWELASLRVLGFTRGEVSVLLLGELALEIAVAIPVGLVAGFGLAALLIFLAPHDVMELPLVINPRTYLLAASVIAVAGVASALVVRSRINRLDLVAVLKTRE